MCVYFPQDHIDLGIPGCDQSSHIAGSNFHCNGGRRDRWQSFFHPDFMHGVQTKAGVFPRHRDIKYNPIKSALDT